MISVPSSARRKDRLFLEAFGKGVNHSDDTVGVVFLCKCKDKKIARNGKTETTKWRIMILKREQSGV
jgi:hypothetical protein